MNKACGAVRGQRGKGNGAATGSVEIGWIRGHAAVVRNHAADGHAKGVSVAARSGIFDSVQAAASHRAAKQEALRAARERRRKRRPKQCGESANPTAARDAADMRQPKAILAPICRE